MTGRAFQFSLWQLLAFITNAAVFAAACATFRWTYALHGIPGMLVHLAILAGLGVITLGCWCFPNIRNAAAAISIIFCVAFAFNQFRGHQRLESLTAEVPRIVAYLESYKDAHGVYPDEIIDGVYQDSSIRQFVKYVVSADSNSFDIVYHPCRGKWLCRCLPHGVYYGYSSTIGYSFSDD